MSKQAIPLEELKVPCYHSVSDWTCRYLNSIPNLPQSKDERDKQDPAAAPKASDDTTLTAFAQLGALRLNAARALISLIDSEKQYILVEATQTLSLQSDSYHAKNDGLWLGSLTIPRSRGACQVVLNGHAALPSTAIRHASGAITISDLQQDDFFKNGDLWKSSPHIRFYAGMPIVASDGMAVGVFCIFDDKPRPGLSGAEGSFMKDLAKSTMDHLDALRIQAQFKRRSELVSGLESFVGGSSAPQRLSYSTEARGDVEERAWAKEYGDPALQRDEDPLATAHDDTDGSQHGVVNPAPIVTPENATTPMADPSMRWEEGLSQGSRPMFTRAANIIRQCGDYDCVTFFYMPSSQTSNKVRRPQSSLNASSRNKKGNVDSSNASSNGYTSPSSPEPVPEDKRQPAEDSRNESAFDGPCAVLASSSMRHHGPVTEPDSKGRFSAFTRRDLDFVLGKRPKSKTISIVSAGVVSGETSSSGSSVEQLGSVADNGDATASKPKKSRMASLRKLHPDAESFVIVPLWDFERQRWFTCCICSSSAARKDVDLDGDLQYLRIFGNSIMMALSRLDAEVSNRAKQSFVSSISHELRSPLHGILGATHFLYDADLTKFQREMVDSISSCGHTLLDTLEHVMDFARINSFSGQKRPTTLTRNNTETDENAHSHVAQSRASTLDLCDIVEEVTEAVWIGHTAQRLPYQFEDLDSFSTTSKSHNHRTSRDFTCSRGRLRITLQIPHRRNWLVHMQAGALRRIIMNIFANALKYTTDGFILLKLCVEVPTDASELAFSLVVEDTGCGISDEYQRDYLFKPFSQENNLSPGSGLGLSIVKQITDDLGGKIRLSSFKGEGTKVRISLTVPVVTDDSLGSKASDKALLEESVRQKVADLRIGILGSVAANCPSQRVEIATKAELEQALGLKQLATDWFNADVGILNSWKPGAADIVVLLEPTFKLLAQIEADSSGLKDYGVLLVTSDTVEMSVLRSDDRLSNSKLVIELIAQP